MTESKKILVAVEDQFLREFYQQLLEGEGYLVDASSDGEMTLDKLKKNEYDLILLDIILPKKDGIQVLQELKINPPKKELTILVLADSTEDYIVKECFNLGAKGCLIKSALHPDQVLSEVRSYL